jgi:insulysin
MVIKVLLYREVLPSLRKFHEDTYSANLMSLVIKSNIPNHEMQKWIEEQSDFV